VVFVEHDHPPVGFRRRLGGVRDIHVERDAVILRDIGYVAELDRVPEPRHRLLCHKPLEEQAVLKLEAGDQEEQQARHRDDPEEKGGPRRDEPPVGDLAQPPEEPRPVGVRGPERGHPTHGKLGRLPSLRCGRDCDRHEQPERAGREHEDLRGKEERHGEDARDHDEEETQDDDLQVVALGAVAHSPVEQKQKVEPDDGRQELARVPEVPGEEEDDGGKREPVRPHRDAGGQGGPGESRQDPGRGDGGHRPGVDVEVEHRRDRQEHEHAPQEPPQELKLVRAKSRPPCFH
jgi:hypothetical protein